MVVVEPLMANVAECDCPQVEYAYVLEVGAVLVRVTWLAVVLPHWPERLLAWIT